MQQDPRYDDVFAEVFAFLQERIATAVTAGIPRSLIIIDPGIGFGKTLQHNVTLLRRLSDLHALGRPILLGASRKRFIGQIAGGAAPQDRLGGSIAVALHGAALGVQILRVHDTVQTRQALSLRNVMTRVEP
jgi:dihydropteroate synthase